jgi:hypothetical protein
MTPMQVEHLLPQAFAVSRRGAADAGRDHHGRAGAAGAQLGDDARDRAGWRGEHRQVRRLRQAGDVGIDRHAFDSRPSRVHRRDLAGEACVEQVARDDGTDRARPIAGADQRHRCGRKQRVEVPNGHGVISASSGR